MITLLRSLPRDVVVAVSGGVDSMVAADFLSRRHNIRLAFFHHGTVNSEQGFELVTRWAKNRALELETGHLTGFRPSGTSPEEWWRTSRYEFLDNLDKRWGPVVTAHHLEDSIETYVWSSMHGKAKLIPYSRNNVIRPFLTTSKKDFIYWAKKYNVPWVEDSSNQDTKYMRNYIRHVLMPGVMHVNPGIHKVVKRLIDKANKICDNRDITV